MKILTDQNKDFIYEEPIVLVDFWAEWCNPCRAMLPILESIEKEMEDLVLCKYNIEDSTIVEDLKIQSIPTLILFMNGAEIKRWIGIQNKTTLLKELKELI
jgi:thioredoxin 1